MNNLLDAIRETWEKEADYCLIIAATEDLKYYPLEIQDVIKAEFKKRGLKKQNAKWLNSQLT